MGDLTYSGINGVCRLKKVERKEVCGRNRETWKGIKKRELVISPSHCLKIDKMIMHFLKCTYTPKL